MLKALSIKPQKHELPLFVKHLEDRDVLVQESSVAALELISNKKIESQNLAKKTEAWKKWARSSEAKNL